MNWTSLRSIFAPRRPQRLADRLAERAVANHQSADRAPVLVISHDAHLAGAQRLLLDLLAEWRRKQSLPIKLICIGSGVLRNRFEQLAPTLVLADFGSQKTRDEALIQFISEQPRAILSNTVVNGPLLTELRSLGAPIITYCHELQSAIERWAPASIMTDTLINSDYMVAACESIARNLQLRHQVPKQRLGIVHAFIRFWESQDAPKQNELTEIRRELGIDTNDVVVFGCGTTDWRKGPDLFLAIAIEACKRDSRLKFIWIGGEAAPGQFQAAIRENDLVERIQFIGNRSDARRYFHAGDIFALTSREDPCALVALEAANAALPVISFAGAGDIPEVLGDTCGAVVPFEDLRAFVSAVLRLAVDSNERMIAGRAGREKVRSSHSSESASTAMENVILSAMRMPHKSLGRRPGSPLVSVIVPNYNHARFLKQRLQSVVDQTLHEIEIILLDDASTDNSRELLESFVSNEPRAKLLCNELNSGSTFKQWRKGLNLAQGKYIWIAESDDFSDRSFLARTTPVLERDPSVVLAHTHSLMVDLAGNVLGRPDDWLNDLAPHRWDTDFISDGITEVRDYLCKKNTIPNASAVVVRNFAGIEALVDDGMRLCADWQFWIRLLARGRYAFISTALNYWRQSSSNARNRPPGVLEWQEGRQVIALASDLLSFKSQERDHLVELFRLRCLTWANGNLEVQ